MSLDARWRGFIRMALRKIYFRYPARFEALKRNEKAEPAFKKDGTPKMRSGKQMMTRRYTCEECGKEELKSTEISIDHISPVGWSVGSRNAPTWWSWNHVIDRMFCDSNGLQLLCTDCHKTKSKQDKQDMKDGAFLKKMESLYLTSDE